MLVFFLQFCAFLGMVELITECETLRKIQTMGGITGSFKDQPLANWLQKHNPTHADYNKVCPPKTITLKDHHHFSRVDAHLDLYWFVCYHGKMPAWT